MQLIKLYDEYGPKWSKIKRHMCNRTSNQLKNRFNGNLKKRLM